MTKKIKDSVDKIRDECDNIEEEIEEVRPKKSTVFGDPVCFIEEY